MIIYVHLEHERLRTDLTLWRYFASKTLETKYRLEAISGDHCLIIRYDRITPSLLDRLKPRALVLSGNYTGFQHFARQDLDNIRAVFRSPVCPTLCICGSFQLMAQTFGAKIESIAPLSAGAGDEATDTPLPPELDPGCIDSPGQDLSCERGFRPVRILYPHPLFEGLDRNPVVFQLHGSGVRSVPDEFRVIADSDLCPVQVIDHKEFILIGIQFHPELYDDTNPDGKQILTNFFRMAGC